MICNLLTIRLFLICFISIIFVLLVVITYNQPQNYYLYLTQLVLVTTATSSNADYTQYFIRINDSLGTRLTKNAAAAAASSQLSACQRLNHNLWTINHRGLFPNCPVLFRSMKNEIKRGEELNRTIFNNWTVPNAHSTDSILTIMLSSCDEFLRIVDFPAKPLSEEEAEFPLAYVFIPFRNLPQAIRLFRMIYQPQNTYCINYDADIEEDYKTAIIKMTSCFPDNVYLNPNPEPIGYGQIRLLRSVMSCLEVLRRSSRQWNYVQIVSWNDAPLKTNLEMVRVFKALNGSQDCELVDNNMPQFFTYEILNKSDLNNYSGVRRPVPPSGITVYKGSFATSMSRDFVDWMFTDPISIRFYQYFDNSTTFAEEFYWTSLIHNIQLNPPGGYPGQCLVFVDQPDSGSKSIGGERKPFISRFQVWRFWTDSERRCEGGFYTHNSCVFGIGDLAMLIQRKELFAHKIYEDYQPALLYCLEEWYWDRTCSPQSYTTTPTGLNISYYENLPAVLYHRLSSREKDSYVCK